MCQRHKSNLNKRTTFFESFVTVVKMEDIRTKSENTTPRQRAAAQIPKEAMRQLWLRSKEKGRTEIESTADGQQGGQYSEANQTGEKVSDALQERMEEGWTTKFLYPGGNESAAWIDVVRTVSRRFERTVVKYSLEEVVSPVIMKYVNRLSDYLYVLRCFVNSREKGGNGRLRIYTFQPTQNLINVQTYSPVTRTFEVDTDSQFTLSY